MLKLAEELDNVSKACRIMALARSSGTKGAKMPHMQRLTWDGIAIHARRLPGYPASHGCVRVPVEFAEWRRS